MEPQQREIVDAYGRPSPKRSDRCPKCHEPASARVRDRGFGTPREICGACGYDFGEVKP